MKITICNENTKSKQLVFKENFVTGGREVFYNDIKLKKIDHYTFEYEEKGNVEIFVFKGSQFGGIDAQMFGKDFVLVEKTGKLDYIFSIILLFLPVFFGILNIVIGVVVMCEYLALSKKIVKMPYRILFFCLNLCLDLTLSLLLLQLF